MNAPAHIALGMELFLTQNVMTPIPPPPYSPDLTPGKHFLFPQMKEVLKGKHFADVEHGKQKTAEALKGIKIDKFKNCFET